MSYNLSQNYIRIHGKQPLDIPVTNLQDADTRSEIKKTIKSIVPLCITDMLMKENKWKKYAKTLEINEDTIKLMDHSVYKELAWLCVEVVEEMFNE